MASMLRISLFTCLLLAVGTTFAADSVPSPTAGDPICSGNGDEDCYPRLFKATTDFRTVREGQDLPPGLHVRLNVWTGQREAKLMDPNEADEVEHGSRSDVAVVVDSTAEESRDLPISPNAPKYDSFGNVKATVDGSEAYHAASTVIVDWMVSSEKSSASLMAESIDTLEELSHDTYFGAEIAGDVDLMKSLVCLASRWRIDVVNVAHPAVLQAPDAARILAAAVRNNPAALGRIEANWGELATKWPCPDGATSSSLLSLMLHLGADSALGYLVEDETLVVKAQLSVVDVLIKSPIIREAFFNSGGKSSLLLTFRRAGAGDDVDWVPIAERTSRLLLDNFLDEDMGAAPKSWPFPRGAADGTCEQSVDETSEDCAESYLRQLVASRGNRITPWTTLVLERLEDLRTPKRKVSAARDEL
jgi:nucleotide exchange factor SIL1